jgi:nicotinate-nucleotide adenylyltransferase
MRIGLFGGTFDPVHLGHLALVEACREGAGLHRVVLVVAGAPPHKAGRPITPAVHRVEMARLAAAGHPALSVDDRETRRAGPSYTIDTLREFRAECAPGDEVCWLIGADSLPELPSWRRAAEILDLAPVVTASRPGHDVRAGLEAVAARLGRERADRLAAGVVPMPLMGISSTDLRERAAAGRSLRYLVPDAVREYIEARGLYRG